MDSSAKAGKAHTHNAQNTATEANPKESAQASDGEATGSQIITKDMTIGEVVAKYPETAEIMLGYGTLFGDTASALNPLGDLYKTQIWQLAEALGVPKKIIDKKPSADLWQNQTDEDELGFLYRDVDRLLYYMVDERRRDAELTKMGFPRDFIARVKNRIRQNQFKRRPPLIAKISQRTVNVDFRYVRDWGI